MHKNRTVANVCLQCVQLLIKPLRFRKPERTYVGKANVANRTAKTSVEHPERLLYNGGKLQKALSWAGLYVLRRRKTLCWL